MVAVARIALDDWIMVDGGRHFFNGLGQVRAVRRMIPSLKADSMFSLDFLFSYSCYL
jgi:hypothetical protein